MTNCASQADTSSPTVSVVNGVTGQPHPEANGPIAEIMGAIKTGRWENEILKIRDVVKQAVAAGKDAKSIKRLVDPLKKRLPAMLTCGTFSERGDDKLLQYSGLLCADLDNLTADVLARAKNTAAQDAHVAAAFVSPTGFGLKVIFSVAGGANQHPGNYFAVEAHVKNRYGLDVDPACKNVERLCFVSYDPDAIGWRTATPLNPIPEPQEKTPPAKPGAETKPLDPGSHARMDEDDADPKRVEKRRAIAEELLGPVDWQSGTEGYLTCPGQAKHTSADADRDCRVTLDKVPTVFCFHSSCKEAVDTANRELRKRIWRAEANFIILPSGNVSITDCARDIFSRANGLYMRGGAVCELVREDGIARLELVTAEGFRTRVERWGKLTAWRTGQHGKTVLQSAKMSADTAKAILASLDAREMLPPVASVLRCPVLFEDQNGLGVLGAGYHPEMGGLLIDRGQLPPAMNPTEAVASLLDLFQEYDFATPVDKSRAVAAVITPAMRMAGFLDGNLPIDVAEADKSQAGKGLRHTLTCEIYGEKAYHVGQRTGGVGSADESFAAALLAGRPFIALDNWRGKLDSPYLESFLTCPGLFPARVPHRSEVMIDPRRFMLQLSSNGVETTRDLANRQSICRIRKREGCAFRDIVGKVRARQSYYLGCVFAVVGAWWEAEKPRTEDTRHDFREWCQKLDWIVRNLFKLAPLMDGHQEAQERVSNPALSWLRSVAMAVEEQGRLGAALTASGLWEVCQGHGIAVPNLKPSVEDRVARPAIGCIMRRLFAAVGPLQVEGYTVERSMKVYRKPSGDRDETPAYTFTAQ